jgi:hypothetical protein
MGEGGGTCIVNHTVHSDEQESSGLSHEPLLLWCITAEVGACRLFWYVFSVSHFSSHLPVTV